VDVNSFSFVASIFASLIWPAMVVVLVLVFREQLRGLLSRAPSKVTAGASGVTLEWEAAESQVKKAIVAKNEPESSESTTLGFPKKSDPSFAQTLVEQSWNSVEKGFRDRMKEILGSEEQEKLDFPELLKEARRSTVFKGSTIQALDGLYKMRDLAATGRIGAEHAEEFALLADSLTHSLQKSEEPKGPAPVGWI
jgi:hypothetical protein